MRPEATSARLRLSRVLCLIAAAAIVATGAGLTTAQPVPTAPSPPMPKAPPGELNTLFLPPGNYTAIVIATTGKDRRWFLSLKTARGSFPITIGPEQTVTIPFTAGWKVTAGDQARLESRLVPFEDLSERTPVDGNETLALSAWGITDQGPVNFAPPARRK